MYTWSRKTVASKHDRTLVARLSRVTARGRQERAAIHERRQAEAELSARPNMLS